MCVPRYADNMMIALRRHFRRCAMLRHATMIRRCMMRCAASHTQLRHADDAMPRVPGDEPWLQRALRCRKPQRWWLLMRCMIRDEILMPLRRFTRALRWYEAAKICARYWCWCAIIYVRWQSDTLMLLMPAPMCCRQATGWYWWCAMRRCFDYVLMMCRRKRYAADDVITCADYDAMLIFSLRLFAALIIDAPLQKTPPILLSCLLIIARWGAFVDVPPSDIAVPRRAWLPLRERRTLLILRHYITLSLLRHIFITPLFTIYI